MEDVVVVEASLLMRVLLCLCSKFGFTRVGAKRVVVEIEITLHDRPAQVQVTAMQEHNNDQGTDNEGETGAT
jgi:hypothetical protein